MRYVRRHHGFTLIELLVVVAIIALLVAMLMPSLSRSKKLAKVVACATGMRGTLASLHIYGNDYGEWPTNERLEGSEWEGGHYYRYATRGGVGTAYIYQMTGKSASYYSGEYRCVESLPADNDRLHNMPTDGRTWTWAARDGSGGAGSMDYQASRVRNGDRSWFAYMGPLRKYPVVGVPAGETPGGACGEWDITVNAWDIWGGGWGITNALSPGAPIYREVPRDWSYSSANFFRKPLRNAVLVNCPTMVRTHSTVTGQWWNQWRAPHGNKPLTGPDHEFRHYGAAADARNYGFADGRVLYVSYGDTRTAGP